MSGRDPAARGRPSFVALALYGAAMGWLEAVVVVYIRALVGFPRGAPPPPERVVEILRSVPWLIPTEQGREAATLVMIAAVGWLAGRSIGQRIGAFLLVFGVWDITYYVGLWAHLGWPTSLASMDLLFLIPQHPWWNQPVWVPVAISVGFIAAGAGLIVRSAPRA